MLQYFFCGKPKVFPFKIIQSLDPPKKMNQDFWDSFGTKNPSRNHLINNTSGTCILDYFAAGISILCPRHEMAEWHVVFTFFVYACVHVYVFKYRVQPITLSWVVGFQSNWAQIIVLTSRCVACKKRVAS